MTESTYDELHRLQSAADFRKRSTVAKEDFRFALDRAWREGRIIAVDAPNQHQYDDEDQPEIMGHCEHCNKAIRIGDLSQFGGIPGEVV
jgi:hypothetical protein